MQNRKRPVFYEALTIDHGLTFIEHRVTNATAEGSICIQGKDFDLNQARTIPGRTLFFGRSNAIECIFIGTIGRARPAGELPSLFQIVRT